MSTRRAWILCLFLAGLAPLSAGQGFEDPAPPKVHVLEKIAAPAAQEVEGLTIHAAPRALHDGAVTEDWPSFLGPRRDGRSRETRLLRPFPDGGPRLLWELERRESYASPVIAQGRLVYVQRAGDRMHVDCHEATTGKRYWRYSIACDYQPRYIRNGGPRSSPVIDGDWVYVHDVQGGLTCLELATGRVRWKRDVCAEFGVGEDYFGIVATPLIVGDLLIQNVGAKDACVVAFDKASGRVRWAAADAWGPSCASPVLGQVHGRERVMVFAGGDSRPPTGGLLVLDPRSGQIDFRYPFRSRRYESVNGSTPVVCGNSVFITDGYGTGAAMLALDAEGGFEETWRSRKLGLEFTTPVFTGGHLYLCTGVNGRAGGVTCVDPATGEELVRAELDFEETVIKDGEERTLDVSTGQGSLVEVDGHLLVLGDTGQLLWLKATREKIEVVSRATPFFASETWTPPVVSGGLLYLCQNNRDPIAGTPARLLCYDLRATE